MKNKAWYSYFVIALGSLIYALATNLFIVPMGLYNSGTMGAAQIIRTILNLDLGFDIAGIFNMLINLPLLITAYFKLNPSFVKKTIFSVAVQTIGFSLIPVNALIYDRLASILIGSLVGGFGVGLILVQRGSSGGTDVASMLLMQKWPKLSVGRFTLGFNAAIYALCAILFNLETAIYSILMAAIFSFVVDRGHLQNIDVDVMIFTKNHDIKKMIINDQHRGVTYWMGQGAYTDTQTEVLVTIVSKFEVHELESRIKEMDPKAFIIVLDNATVVGNVEKRLI